MVNDINEIGDKELKEMNRAKQKILNTGWFHIKVFEEKGEENNIEKVVLSKSNVVCMFSKSEIGKEIIKEFDESGADKMPKLEFYSHNNNEIVGIYDSDILYKIMGVMNQFNELNKTSNTTGNKKITQIKMLNDYPIRIENSHIGFIVAPRVYD